MNSEAANPIPFPSRSFPPGQDAVRPLRLSAGSAPRRRFLGRLLGAGGATLVVAPSFGGSASGAQAGDRSVLDFGATGDGIKLDTQALQAAIDACAQAGGGTAFFPAGKYLTGSLFLKSHVTLHLAAGATLLGSKKLDDYPVRIPAIRSYTDNYTERSLIYGENLEDVAIEGRGVIDGQGAAFKGPYKVRPYLMRLVGCREVSVRGITLKDSPMWVQHYLACDGVLIDGVRVVSRCNANNDGIDIDGCERVRIANCDIRSGDDAIVLKSTLDRPCRNVAITNCVLSSDCNAFKLGTESNGGFENIVLSNCTIYDTRISGIALEMVDGGTLERVNISNVTMHNTRSAIFIRLGNRARPFKEGMTPPDVGRLRQVRISDVQALGANDIGCSITGLPEHPVEDIALENVSVQFSGGGKADDARREIPEQETKYPEYSMFGRLPALRFLLPARARVAPEPCAGGRGRSRRPALAGLPGRDRIGVVWLATRPDVRCESRDPLGKHTGGVHSRMPGPAENWDLLARRGQALLQNQARGQRSERRGTGGCVWPGCATRNRKRRRHAQPPMTARQYPATSTPRLLGVCFQADAGA